MYTLEDSINTFSAALRLETFLSRRTLFVLRRTFLAGTILTGTAGLVMLYGLNQDSLGFLFVGACLIFLSLWTEQMFLISYHNSYYFRGLNSVIGLDEKKITSATYEVAKALLKRPDDIT
ncbi:MAG TPA: hypothetical protein VGE31_03200, partial [Candidatus Paceibacterota bacterium]